MRKKVIGILLIVVMLASALSGCLAVNTERDMKQVVSTVNYKGMTANVTKLEILEVYAQNVQTYVQYYGMTEREVFDYFLNQISVRKLLVLDAADRGLCQWDNANMKIVADSLTIAQRNEAQDEINKQLEELFDDYVEIVTDEYSKDTESGESGTSGSSGATSGTEDEEEEDTRTVRPLPTVEEDEEEYSNTELNVSSWMQNFEYSNNIERIAFKRLEKLLADQYKNEEYLLQAQYQTLVIKALQEKLYEAVNVTDAQIIDKFITDRTNQKEKFNADESAYASAINSNQVVFYHKTPGFGTVKHILLSFEEASAELDVEKTHIFFDVNPSDPNVYTKAELDRRKESNLYTDDQINEYRLEMMRKIKVVDYGDFADWWATYDKDANEDLIDWRDTKYNSTNPRLSISNFLSEVIQAVNAKSELKDKISKFVDYIFGYNAAEETGMFNNENDYVIEPDGTKYMAEFQAVSEYLISGKALPSDIDPLNFDISEGTGLGKVGFCITDYGVHLVMATNVFSDDLYAAAESARTADSLKAIIINNEKGSNLYDYIKDSIIAAEKNNVMTSYQSNFIDIYGESSITLNNGVIDAIFA